MAPPPSHRTSTTLNLALILFLAVAPAAGYHPRAKPPTVSGAQVAGERSVCGPPLAPATTSTIPPAPPGHGIYVGGSSSRREALKKAAVVAASILVGSSVVPPSIAAVGPEAAAAGYRYGPDWTGTALTLLSPREAATLARRGNAGVDNGASASFAGGEDFSFPMARWPDPLLRRPAAPAPPSLLGTSELRDVAYALRATARAEGAVGLAAQQCGVDVRMVWLDDESHAAPGDARRSGVVRWLSERLGVRRNTRGTDDGDDDGSGSGSGSGGENDAATGTILGEGVRGHHYYHASNPGLFLINPRIVSRSSEVDMRVWTERCLVLPPTFSASVLRDATIEVEYDDLEDGSTRRVTLGGELARAAQHEMDHDRGILITDHVGLEELESDDMRRVEEGGHEGRMAVAYARTVEEPSSSTSSSSSSSASREEGSRGLAMSRSGAGDERRRRAFWEEVVVPPARAADDDGGDSAAARVSDDSSASICDAECLARRRRIVEERRAMMRQSRSSTSRADVFELSRQRAALYNATYRGAECPPGVPCL